MNRIFDCFTFFNELDLLEFRLEYLDPVVDYFVIAESNLTHSGNEKPYNYHNNSKRYEKWSDKIIYLPIVQEKEGLSFDQVNSYTPSNGSWILENQQRNSLSYVYPRVGDKDLVLIGDLDEIPELGILMYYKNLNKQGVLVPTYSFRQLFHYYYMNCQNIGFERIWNGTVMASGEIFKRNDPQTFRDKRNNYEWIEDGGYHFSFLGGVEKIRTKIQSFAHTEFNRPELTSDEHIMKCLEEGYDVFNRPGVQYKFYPLDWYPMEIRKLMEKYPQFIKEV